uniref:Uncharacterized protein n=1 Tax=Babesia motasi TaxID=237580 RepID=A0A411ADB1_9APIC|nr:hypothetical protein [Babesia motasi]
MNTLQQSINIIALNIKHILDKIISIIIELLTYIQTHVNIYLNKHRLSTVQKIMYKGYGLLYALVQVGAIYTFLPCAGLSALHGFCALAMLEILSNMGVIKQRRFDRYKWLCDFLKNGKI